MKRYFPSAALLFLSLCFNISIASAQTCEANLTKEAKLKSSGDVQVEYRKETNETAVRFKPYVSNLPLDHNFIAERINLSVGFRYAGQTPPDVPSPITFALSTFTQNRLLFSSEESRRVVIRINGENVFSGAFTLRGEPVLNKQTDENWELLTLDVPLEVLEKMVKGKEVALELGEKRIKIGKNYQKRFCQILSYAEAD